MKSLFLVTITLLCSSLFAEDHFVKMVNTDANGQIMVFDPPFLKFWVGDTVTFLPTDALHNSQSISYLSPNDGDSWLGEMNEELKVEFSTEGVYVYQCAPHIALGMIGVIQVGAPSNLDEINNNLAALETMIAVNKNRAKDYLSLVN